MNLKDLDKIIEDYFKHYSKEDMAKHLKNLINKGENNATSKKETNSSSRSNK